MQKEVKQPHPHFGFGTCDECGKPLGAYAVCGVGRTRFCCKQCEQYYVVELSNTNGGTEGGTSTNKNKQGGSHY